MALGLPNQADDRLKSEALPNHLNAVPYHLVTIDATVEKVEQSSSEIYKNMMGRPRLDAGSDVVVLKVSVRTPISDEMKEALERHGLEKVQLSMRSRYARCGYQADIIPGTVKIEGDSVEADLFVYPVVSNLFPYSESTKIFFDEGDDFGRFYIFDEEDVIDRRETLNETSGFIQAINNDLLLSEEYKLEEDGTVSVPLLPRIYYFVEDAINETRERMRSTLRRFDLQHRNLLPREDPSPIPPRTGRICAIYLKVPPNLSVDIVPEFNGLVHLNSRLLDGNTGPSQSHENIVMVEVFNNTDQPIPIEQARVKLRFVRHRK